MNIPDEAEKRFPYDYAREGDRFTTQQAFIEGAEWARKEALTDLLPPGAEWFPLNGGIQWQGDLYFPADYVLTRLDIQAIKSSARKEALREAAAEIRFIPCWGDAKGNSGFDVGPDPVVVVRETIRALAEES